jgi:hypothetical protein
VVRRADRFCSLSLPRIAAEGPGELLTELYIRRYKNLEVFRMPLGARVVLYGENGTGKTNVLEALALVAGSHITTYQVAPRLVAPDPGAIEVVTTLRGQATAMPWTCSQEATRAWWASIGVDDMPQSWQTGIDASSLPDEIKRAVLDPSSCALRYSLVAVDGLDRVRAYDRGVAWREGEDDPPPVLSRRFDTTLCVPKSVGDELRSAKLTLPELARPLVVETIETVIHETVGTDRAEWVDVLAMPPASQVPFQVSWLARERSGDELWAECSITLNAAAAAFRRLMTAAQEVLDQVTWPAEVTDEAEFLANRLLTDYAKVAVGAIAPRLHLDPEHDGFSLSVNNARKLIFLGAPGDEAWIQRLSSGERVLVDEALLDALDGLQRDSFVATIGSAFLDSARTRFVGSDDGLLDLQIELAENSSVANGEGFWTVEDLRCLLSWTARVFEQTAGASLPSGRLPIVRLFDEPERHLHPLAQRRLAEALRQRDQDQIVVASHSPTFLELRGWAHLSLKWTEDGVIAEVVDPPRLEIAHDFARRIGLRPADLLNLYRYVLIVEGPHDEAFLTGYAGGKLGFWGVLVLRMHGVDQAIQVADLDLVNRLALPVGTLIDYGRTKAGTPRKSKESASIDQALRLAKRRGQRIDDFRLERPDIVAYISDDVLREEVPKFPGFRAVEDRWRNDRPLRKFKELASEMANGYTFHSDSIRDLAARTAARERTPPRDLARFMADLEAAARNAPMP